jgi:hypothetical protein
MVFRCIVMLASVLSFVSATAAADVDFVNDVRVIAGDTHMSHWLKGSSDLKLEDNALKARLKDSAINVVVLVKRSNPSPPLVLFKARKAVQFTKYEATDGDFKKIWEFVEALQ